MLWRRPGSKSLVSGPEAAPVGKENLGGVADIYIAIIFTKK